MQVALHISKQFTYTLPCLKPLCGIDIWNHFKLFDMKCRRVAGCRRNIRKIIMNQSQVDGRGRHSDKPEHRGSKSKNIKFKNIEQCRFRRYPSVIPLRTFGIDFYQITKQLQGEFTAQGGSGTLRWIKYPP